MAGHGNKKDISSIVAFVAITFVSVYSIYYVSTAAFDLGRKQGEAKRQAQGPPPPREVPGAPTAPKIYDVRELRKPTPELTVKGKKVFEANCSSCHGAEGYGDGAGAARLVVKPANFHTKTASMYKNGNAPLRLWKTLNEGVGGNMPAFPALNDEEKFAVIHYVRASFIPEAERTEDDPKDIAAIPAPAAAPSGPIVVADMGPRVSIDFAISQLAAEDTRPFHEPRYTDPDNAKTLGQRLFLMHCQKCHGPDGQGGIPYDVVSYVPKIRLRAQSLASGSGAWQADKARFVSIVTEGVPGRFKTGTALFSQEEMDALYEYTLTLATGKQTADAGTK